MKTYDTRASKLPVVVHSGDMANPSPFLRLPNELIEELTLQVAEDHMQQWLLHPTGQTNCDWAEDPSFYGWLPITHVCRCWRDVALQSPRLWTNVCLTRSECVKAFLERSGNMPLHVFGASVGLYRCLSADHPTMGRDQYVIKLLEMVWQELYRVRGFHEIPMFPLLDQTLESALPSEAPMLQSLSFEFFHPNSTVSAFSVAQAHIPNLAHLRLAGLENRLEPAFTLLRPTLTALHLTSCNNVSVEACVDILKSLPLLEYFSCKKVQRDMSEEVDMHFDPLRAVSLPRLKSLYLQDHDVNPGSFLGNRLLLHLILPKPTSIFFDTSTAASTSLVINAFSHLHRLMQRSNTGLERVTYSQCMITEEEISGQRYPLIHLVPAEVPFNRSLLGTVPGYHTTDDFGSMEVNFGLKIALPELVYLDNDDWVWTDSIRLFCQSQFPLSEISELYLHGESDLYDASGQSVLDSFSGLRTLVLDGLHWPRRFLQGLSESLDAGCVLPELCTLKLVNTRWCKHAPYKQRGAKKQVEQAEEGRLAEVLISTLTKWGAETGKILEEIIISHPVDFSEGDIETLELSGAVTRVIWDAGNPSLSCLQCFPTPVIAVVDTCEEEQKPAKQSKLERLNTVIRNVIKGWSGKR